MSHNLSTDTIQGHQCGNIGVLPIVALIPVAISVVSWVASWISSQNRPDTWSSWDDATKEQFVTDALNAAFYQTEIPARDWFWRATSDAGYSSSGYEEFINANSDWIPARISSMEARTGRKWTEKVNVLANKPANTASVFSTKNIVASVLFIGIAFAILYNAAGQKPESEKPENEKSGNGKKGSLNGIHRRKKSKR